jgi:hypothetical protein
MSPSPASARSAREPACGLATEHNAMLDGDGAPVPPVSEAAVSAVAVSAVAVSSGSAPVSPVSVPVPATVGTHIKKFPENQFGPSGWI